MNLAKTRNWWVVIVAVCFFASVLRADTLKLKDGRTIQGKYLGGTDSQITFYTNGNLEHFAISDATSITFGGQDTTLPATSTTSPAAPAPAASPSAASSGTVLVPAGTHLVVRMINGVDSDTNKVGDAFEASLEDPLTINGTLVAPQGTTVYGKLEQVKSAGKITGQSELRLGLTGIVINGATYNITTGDYSVQGKSRGKQTAERAGIGAGLGAIIGAIAGGGKGAAIGAGVGGAAGTGVQVLTQGQQVHVPSETVLDFTLQQPINLPVSTSTAPVH
jgi:YMGG-like Gly-zipper